MSFSCCPQLLSNEPVLIPGYYCLGWQFMQICRCWPTGLVLKLTLIQLLFRYQCLKQKWARREMTAVFFSLCFVWNCGQIFFFQVPIPDREKWWTSLSSIFFTTKTSGMCQKMNLPFVWNLVHKSFAFFSQKKRALCLLFHISFPLFRRLLHPASRANWALHLFEESFSLNEMQLCVPIVQSS